MCFGTRTSRSERSRDACARARRLLRTISMNDEAEDDPAARAQIQNAEK
jgi:hypothetical protein